MSIPYVPSERGGVWCQFLSGPMFFGALFGGGGGCPMEGVTLLEKWPSSTGLLVESGLLEKWPSGTGLLFESGLLLYKSPQSGGYQSRHYASYWNAFLLTLLFYFVKSDDLQEIVFSAEHYQEDIMNSSGYSLHRIFYLRACWPIYIYRFKRSKGVNHRRMSMSKARIIYILRWAYFAELHWLCACKLSWKRSLSRSRSKFQNIFDQDKLFLTAVKCIYISYTGKNFPSAFQFTEMTVQYFYLNAVEFPMPKLRLSLKTFENFFLINSLDKEGMPRLEWLMNFS